MQTKIVWLDELPVKSFSEGIPSTTINVNQGGDSLRISGKTFQRGIGVASTSILTIELKGEAQSFSALVGVDDQGSQTLPHHFYVLGDKKILFESGPMKWGDAPRLCEVDLKNIRRMGMLVTVEDQGHTKVYTDWVNAKFLMSGDALPVPVENKSERYILTPASDASPKINSPSVFGARPGNPFLYVIAATGARPMKFEAKGLPPGLILDPETGIISGKVILKGNYSATLRAHNKHGIFDKQLRIRIGDTIALTPPIGWNGWNSWSRAIDREKVIASAQAMVNMGLKDHGWSYVNIDDAWQGNRGGELNAIQPNVKFPRFKEMVDTIHHLGLKLGVYSTPWITSYAGYTGGSSNFADGHITDSIIINKRANRYVGKYRFEESDARQMAEWGVDYLKYDWRIETTSALRMARALEKSGRDIVYSISNSAPFVQVNDWKRMTNLWRTGPDIRDSWHGLYTCTFTLDKWAPHAGPGHWNDPDMMIVGNVTTGSPMHPTRLTPDEQYSHVSLYALLSAPMLIGCPIEQLDSFTLNLLTNDEVIAINQDPLGKSARLIKYEEGIQIWLKPLEDGSYALGLFNLANYGKTPASYFKWGDETAKEYSLQLGDIGLKEMYDVRDLWRQKNLGTVQGVIKTTIPFHGVKLFRLFNNSLQSKSLQDTVWLDRLNIQSFSEGIRPVKSGTNYQGELMRMGGIEFKRGIGLQSVSVIPLQLNRKGIRFHAVAGADEMGNKDIPIRFYVLGDGKLLFEGKPMRVGDAPETIDLDIRGIDQLGLLVKDDVGGVNNKRTYGNWAEASLIMHHGYEPAPVPNETKKEILTPLVSPKPRIHSPRLFGVRPGYPFLYTISASGNKPMHYEAIGLPAGLSLNTSSGIISGQVKQRGKYNVLLKAINSKGRDSLNLEIRVGDTIALTPPIGWNGWNSWAFALDKEKVLASAKAMVDKGLADFGWTYINIDDTWQGKREGPEAALMPNDKFPDFKGMADTIHQLGLKVGLYSTPYISSYAGYPGASSDYAIGGEDHALISKNRQPFMRIGPYRFEETDARQMAKWGIDFLKYDWRIDPLSAERMYKALEKSGRDIVLSISNSAPFEKVSDWTRTSNMYRTGPDIRDSWNSMYLTTFSLDKWSPYTGHGHWADPDMMILGMVSTGSELHPTRLTPNEQYSHVSMNALLSAPMLIGCPIDRLDSFTLSLLTNGEVMAINQDPLGKAARLIRENDGIQLWMKPMHDGSYAVGLFYTNHYGETPASYFRWGNETLSSFRFNASTVGLKGLWKVRDVWRQKDVGILSDMMMSTQIPHHGVSLYRLYPLKKK